jgi:hemoglobin-like flavoprotein
MSLNIELLENSFAALAPRADQLADRFYQRLCAEHPQVRAMFRNPMEQQRKHLIAALVMIVQSLRQPEKLMPYLQQLGQRHAEHYDVLCEHYPIVGRTLLATMAELAGEAWTVELEQAWSDAYAAVQSLMLSKLDGHHRAA